MLDLILTGTRFPIYHFLNIEKSRGNGNRLKNINNSMQPFMNLIFNQL
jgi:hypothetical protein